MSHRDIHSIGGISMKVVATKKDEKGTITQYKLDDGTIVNHEQAVSLVESGQIEGCNISTARNGLKSIRSDRDDNPNNNLDNLPTF